MAIFECKAMLENHFVVWYSKFMASIELDYVQKLRKQRNKKILTVIVTFILFCLLLNLLFVYVLFPVHVRSTDMLSEYEPNCLVFVAPCNFAKPLFFQRYSLERGNVVYVAPSAVEEKPFYEKILLSILKFFTFQQYKTSSDSIVTESPSLRRVVGLPGDTVYMKNYIVYIKPQGEKYFLTEHELASRAYETNFLAGTAHDQSMGIAGTMEKRVLGENEYFLLADNRISAVDSRLYGPVPAERIAGKALLRYFPIKSFSFL